jgi:hypothetical protein
MKSISFNLYDFLKKISKNLLLPDKKFLRDTTIGFLRSGNPIVCQMACHLPKQRTKFVWRLAGNDKPMMLLTNLPVENLVDTKHILIYVFA